MTHRGIEQTVGRRGRVRGAFLGPLALCFLLPSFADAAGPSPRMVRGAGPGAGSSDPVVQFINESIRQNWEANEIKPSPVAEDSDWARRVYLDIVGHIPPVDELTEFLESDEKDKRTKLIERLLDDPGYVRNWTTIWTNLCIGRQTPDQVSRMGMEKFFREAFAKNRPWDEIVAELVSAEGHYEQNGAVNFLLAQMQMPDEGVQATAKTTRLFLGMQVQCTQCHNHPFIPEWKQDQFWQFNSFFRQARKVVHQKYDPRTGRMEDDYIELVQGNYSGPVYFERRSGLMQVAFPIYFDEKVDPGPETDRRRELARLMTNGDPPLIAEAMVNRVWGRFFGYGFTRPLDDMGPHNPPSHPELIDRLSREFVAGGYDLKQLIRWIANSEAYHLTSRFGKSNESDNPAAGEMPLFSRVYVKSMEAEQLYDSLIIATNAHKSGRSNWSEAEARRQEWLQQFVIAFDTDEADETTTFNGTIPQALMMMNGPLVDNAISAEPGSFLQGVLTERGSESQKVQKLYLAALSRYPTRLELSAAQKLLRSPNKTAAFQDLFWALLNSNEFVFVH
jgi:hypothetical protein